ncbi:hypothetical protein, partial [Bradyrhizobium japonicum]|uniref:hypothetical protein n=1 Tax=Bradyrhizobium japonicum TaxID=375 RepID=UPI001AEBB024
MSFSTWSAGALPSPDFCFICAPGGYDEPEILPPQILQFVSDALTANSMVEILEDRLVRTV